MTEINPIYRTYQSRSQSIETTLELIEDIMQENLSTDYRRIWVQASNSGTTRFCITLFPTNYLSNYRMVFHNMNIRQWRPSTSDDALRIEISNIEKIIEILTSAIKINI
jgi:hypothetical protein